jgi:hypothetical protein
MTPASLHEKNAAFGQKLSCAASSSKRASRLAWGAGGDATGAWKGRLNELFF